MSNTMQPRDRWIPWYFVLFFAVIAIVNAGMVTMALRTHSGLVTDHPYEKGLAYNDVIDGSAKQAALGWKSDISLKKSVLHFTLRDADNKPLAFTTATASFARTTQSGLDFTVDLKGSDTPVTLPAQGLWHVRIAAIANGKSYQTAARLVAQ